MRIATLVSGSFGTLGCRHRVSILLGAASVALAGVSGLWWATSVSIEAAPADFDSAVLPVRRMQVTDRHGTPLNATYANDWNLHDVVALYDVPELLIAAFVRAEDKRFFAHDGQDWLARFGAVKQNVLAMRQVRGASTITEQVVRMLHPRPRTLWSRWLEGWEAERLETVRTKLDILEFYLNQVPYAANRRGIRQAARYYFDRDLETLSRREMLTLAVLVRAPSRLDPYRGDQRALHRAIDGLAARLEAAGYSPFERSSEFDLKAPALPVNAGHFLQFVVRHAAPHDAVSGGGRIGSRRLRSTLDGSLQARLQGLLDQRLRSLAQSKVQNASLLVADHRTGEVLAWVVGAAAEESPGHLIDAVVTPRQPGSALKPFLYGLALQSDWTAATLIEDAPLSEMIGFGLHSYSNYSRTFYGPITLREALGNSLNIPALRAIQHTGAEEYLGLLERLGFKTLSGHPDYYGDGLALGNGEVTLLELVQAYGALANRGLYREFALQLEDADALSARRVFSPEVASLLGDILSDPDARRLEFGGGGTLDLPVQTAVKTGTSSDYRDSWAVGYDDRHVAGVWMGNLDQTPMLGVTGSTGPALVLRATFDMVNSRRTTAPLWLSPRLKRHVICADTGIAFKTGMTCPQRSEYFVPGTAPEESAQFATVERETDIRLLQPTPGLHMAYDPRLPAIYQGFEFLLQGVAENDLVDWRIDGKDFPGHTGSRYLWSLSRGDHSVSASVWREGRLIASTGERQFLVK